MEHALLGGILIAAGIGLIIYREPFIRYSTEFRNKYMGFNFGERTIAFGIKVAILIGILTIVLGILTVLGLVDNLNNYLNSKGI